MAAGKKRAQDKTTAKPASSRWVKGQSGNPSGRPKLIGHVRELAQAYTEESIQTLVEIMRDKKAHATSRAAAAQSLLDRGWGKAAQPVGGTDDLPPIRTVRDLTEAELMAMAQQVGRDDG